MVEVSISEGEKEKIEKQVIDFVLEAGKNAELGVPYTVPSESVALGDYFGDLQVWLRLSYRQVCSEKMPHPGKSMFTNCLDLSKSKYFVTISSALISENENRDLGFNFSKQRSEIDAEAEKYGAELKSSFASKTTRIRYTGKSHGNKPKQNELDGGYGGHAYTCATKVIPLESSHDIDTAKKGVLEMYSLLKEIGKKIRS